MDCFLAVPLRNVITTKRNFAGVRARKLSQARREFRNPGKGIWNNLQVASQMPVKAGELTFGAVHLARQCAKLFLSATEPIQHTICRRAVSLS